MALTFPRTDIIQPLEFKDGYFTPNWRQESSRTQGGQLIIKDLGPLLWLATYTTNVLTIDEAMELETDLLSLRGGMNLFEGHDPRRPWPKSDPVSPFTGVTVFDIRSDRKALRLTGLPANFVLSKADGLSVNDGLNLHYLRALEGDTASAAGVSGWFEVEPYARATISIGDDVALRYAPARFAILKDSIRMAKPGFFHRTITFQGIQVLE